MTIPVFTVFSGHTYRPIYVERLQRMLTRHMPADHHLTVLCDAATQPAVANLGLPHCRLEERGLKGFCSKIQLFNPDLTGTTPFLYFDITLVVRSSLEPLLHFASTSKFDVIGVRDWNYPTLNSCLMHLRPGAATARVWQSYLEGENHGTPGPNQNFIYRVLQQHCPETIGFWPEGLVASYRELRKKARHDPSTAEQAHLAACVLKFHGRPRPHEVLSPWRHPSQTVLKHPFRPDLWSYLADDIHAHWC
ncbi:hypothetical protein KBY70_12725 [Cyanobium sp. ATX 6E8]|uniref:hypothetical protein n=1 Tax=Cyanobium sp. ATX 6E8 TaxID=2823701 RepID=UPI0020CDB1AA|nr:hypothetical protein [Cyanobium sp. ATX 6E8]MCP9943251.1 hypothetical protein [Cyanobium sp. ATX 6E8]